MADRGSVSCGQHTRERRRRQSPTLASIHPVSSSSLSQLSSFWELRYPGDLRRMRHDDSEFQRCLELLRGPQDEHRFVGLLWAPRFLEQGVYDPSCAEDRVNSHLARARAIYDAVGPRFLLRLLRTHSREGGWPVRVPTAAARDRWR